jgi:ferric-dicitrate binding protein FerR (iron transport regulator)
VKLEGEAFFEVARNEQSPFIIDAQSADVKVLGTSFNVNCTKQQASVVVKTGKVQMTAHSQDASVILTPGEKGLLQNDQLSEEIVQPDNYLYWKTGILNFANQPLAEIVKEIRAISNIGIAFNENMSPTMQQQLISISFRQQSPEDMLTDLCLVAGCQLTRTENGYLISAK